MARCLGSNPPYGCGHFNEHQDAALKGWQTRRHGAAFRSSDEHKALSSLFGGDITHAHEHPEHKGMVRFKSGGKWYELPRKGWNDLVREGRAHQREQAREAERQRREDEKNERIYQRESARLEKIADRERAQREQKAARARQEAERNKAKEERYKAAQERQLSAARKAEYQSVVKRIRQLGGIRPYRTSGTSGKTPELEEWRDLPRAVKTRDQGRGVALDDAAATINEEFPWLRIHDDSDLKRFLENEHRNQGRGQRGRRRERRAA